MIEPTQGLLAQVLGYYRSPLNYPHLIAADNPLPDELPDLLEMLNESNRTGTRLQKNAGQLAVSADELSQAAFFYIKQALFASDADYYRTLGLSQDASADAIKRHYRMLIGLFHPDKNPEGEIWDNLYATRINEVYNTLKRPEKRKAYDNQRDNAGSAPENREKHPQHAVRMRRPGKQIEQGASAFQRIAGSYLWQKYPKVVVTGIIGAVLLLVLLFAAMSSDDPALEISENTDASSVDETNRKPGDERREAFMRAIRNDADAKAGRADSTRPAYSDGDANTDSEGGTNDEQILQQIGAQLVAEESSYSETAVVVDHDAAVSADHQQETTQLPVDTEAEDKPVDEPLIAASELAGELAVAELIADNALQAESVSTTTEVSEEKPVKSVQATVQRKESSSNEQPAKVTEVSLEKPRANNTRAEKKTDIKADESPEGGVEQLPTKKVEIATEAQEQDGSLPAPEVKMTEQKAPVSNSGQGAAEAIIAVTSSSPEPMSVIQEPSPVVARSKLLAQSDQLLMQYVSYYEAGNLLGILNLFSPQVLMDGRTGIQHAAKKFDTSFSNSQQRRMRLQRFKGVQTGPGEVVMDVLADIQQLDYHGDTWEQYRSELKMHFVESNQRLYISKFTQTILKDVQ